MLCLTRLVARAARAFCGSRRSANTQPTLLFLNGQEDLLLVMQFGCLHHPIPPRTTPPPLRTYATPQASYPGGAGAASAGRGGQAVEDAQTRLPPTLASSIVMPQLTTPLPPNTRPQSTQPHVGTLQHDRGASVQASSPAGGARRQGRPRPLRYVAPGAPRIVWRACVCVCPPTTNQPYKAPHAPGHS